jgi:hypothetical protein
MGEIYEKLKKIQEQRNENESVVSSQQHDTKDVVSPRMDTYVEKPRDTKEVVSPRINTYVRAEKPQKENPGFGMYPLFIIAIIVIGLGICVLTIGTANNYVVEKRNLLTQVNNVEKITNDNAKASVFFTQEITDIEGNLKSINRKLDDVNAKFSRVELQSTTYASEIKALQQEKNALSEKLINLESQLAKMAEEIKAKTKK